MTEQALTRVGYVVMLDGKPLRTGLLDMGHKGSKGKHYPTSKLYKTMQTALFAYQRSKAYKDKIPMRIEPVYTKRWS